MNRDTSRPATRYVVRPLLLILVSFPIACFIGALATDIIYIQNADMMWADFSAWLLALGMGVGVVAAIVGGITLLANRTMRAQLRVWPLVIGSVLVLVIGFVDNLVHSRDAWTSVMPEGLALSAINVVVIILTAWLGFATAARLEPGVPYTGVRS